MTTCKYEIADAKIPYGLCIVAAPPICEPRTLEMNFRGLRGSKNRDVANVCWLETGLLSLMSDPYIRHFMLDLFERNEYMYAPNPALALEYKLGLAVGYAIAFRADPGSQAMSKEDWDKAMDELLQHIKIALSTFGAFSNILKIDIVADPAEFLQIATLGIHSVIANNFAYSHFGKAYMTHGFRVIQQIDQYCSNTECPKFVVPFKSFVNGGSSEPPSKRIQNLLNVSENSGKITVQPTEMEGRLDVLVNEKVNQRFLVNTVRCSHCVGPHPNFLVYKHQLVNLPWMLTFQVNRITKSIKNEEGVVYRVEYEKTMLTYDPNKLKVGPTANGKYAYYKLMSRLNRRPGHYVIDLRVCDTSEQFLHFDSLQQMHSNSEQMSYDTDSVFMVWKRIK